MKHIADVQMSILCKPPGKYFKWGFALFLLIQKKKLFLHLSFVARPAACDQSGCAAHCQLCRLRVCTYVLPHPWINLQIVIWIWVLLYHFHSAPSSAFMLVRSEGRYRQTSTKRAVRENETFQLAAALDCQMQQGCDLSDLWHSLLHL